MFLKEFPGDAEREASYQDDYYEKETGGRFVAIFEGAIALLLQLRVLGILRREKGPASLLDVGCGRGNLLGAFRNRGWRTLGLQLSGTAAEAARRRWGVEVRCEELTDTDLPPGSFRVVTFYHVLEHLPRPKAYLLRARQLLEERGLLVAEVPNHGGAGFRLLRRRHLCYDYPHHLHFFTPSSLRGLFSDCGFEVESQVNFSLEYSPFTTLQNMLNLLPGEPNLLYRGLMRGAGAARLRRLPRYWLHGALALALSPLALALSSAGLVLPVGNTMCFYCRKVE